MRKPAQSVFLCHTQKKTPHTHEHTPGQQTHQKIKNLRKFKRGNYTLHMSVSQKLDQSWTLRTHTHRYVYKHSCSGDHLVKALEGEGAKLLLISMRIIWQMGGGWGSLSIQTSPSNRKLQSSHTQTHPCTHTCFYALISRYPPHPLPHPTSPPPDL